MLTLAVTALVAAPAWADGGVLSGLTGSTTTTTTAPTSTTSGSTGPLGGLLGGLSPVTSASQANPSYWIVGSEGGVGAYGGTPFKGSMANTRLIAPVIGSTSTADGGGYWLVASDGGIFSFGDAVFHGSMGGKQLAAPVVGMAATPDGNGYWLVAADGGIFSFGDAVFHGSMGGKPLSQPMVGMAPTSTGLGYWTVASDGGIFSFGDAVFHGSMGGKPLAAPMVGMAAVPGGAGYWTVGADGGMFSFGSAPFRGSAYGYVPIGEWISSMAEGPGNGTTGEVGDFSTPVAAGGAPYGHAATGYDISWPQCGGAYPPSSSVAVVGVNDGSAFTTNPCFGSEASWGGPGLTVYVNLNSPQGSDATQWGQGPAGTCAMGDLNCESYNYGYNTARNSISTAQANGHGTRTWWLDVETGNYWTSDTGANDQVMAGAIAAIHQAGYAAAIYSTNYQWGQIAGNYVPSVPVWYPTGVATNTPGSWCSGTSFAGGPVYLVQSAAGSYDGDYSC